MLEGAILWAAGPAGALAGGLFHLPVVMVLGRLHGGHLFGTPPGASCFPATLASKFVLAKL